PKTNDHLAATVSASDADGDPITYTYVWKVNGSTVQTTTTTNTTDTLDLSQSGFGDKGQSIYVTVTPNDGVVAGEPVSSDLATVPHSAPVPADPGNQQFVPGDVVTLPITATDPDGDSITYSASGLPTWLSINSTTGVISGTVPEDATNYDYSVNIGA